MAELQPILSQIAMERNFENFNIDVHPNTKKGDNYLADTATITIKDATQNLELFCKSAETDEIVRSQIPIHNAYLREVFVYDHLLPFFVDFQEKLKIKHPFKSFVQKFRSSVEEKKEFLILENIIYQGFSMEDRKTTMTDDCIRSVFCELAKWHSLSLVLKQKDPVKFNDFSSKLNNIFDTEKLRNKWVINLEQKLIMASDIFDTHPNIQRKLLNMKNNVEDINNELMLPKNHLVFIHGDSWCNNIMFKYESNKPPQVRFIDWQICRHDSPMSDLSYFFFLAASRKSLDNYKEFLDEYYKIIQENLDSVGCNIDKLFPRNLLMEQWKLFTKVGFFIALSNLQIAMQDAEDSQSFAELSRNNEGRHVMDILWKNDKPSEEFCKRITDIVEFMDENDFL